MKEQEQLWNKTLKIRNQLQQMCVRNGHSYHEEIKILIPDGITIETTIGGNNGNKNISFIYPDNNFFERMAEHINNVKEHYDNNHNIIIKDKL